MFQQTRPGEPGTRLLNHILRRSTLDALTKGSDMIPGHFHDPLKGFDQMI